MMKERIESAGVMFGVLAIFLLCRYFFNFAFDILWLAIICACSYEMTRVFEKGHRPQATVWLWIYPAIATLALFVSGFVFKLPFWGIMLVEAILFVFSTLVVVAIEILIDRKRESAFGKKYITKFALNTMFEMLFPTFLMLSMYFLNHLVDLGIVGKTVSTDNTTIGYFAIAFVLLTSIATDTFAMLGGMMFKGKKLCPTISFNKTVSGFVCGLVFGCIASLVVFWVFQAISATSSAFLLVNFTWWKALILGLISALATTFGDLMSSYIKRRCFVKDFSNLIAGHGGVLDRVNGVAVNSFVCMLAFVIIF